MTATIIPFPASAPRFSAEDRKLMRQVARQLSAVIGEPVCVDFYVEPYQSAMGEYATFHHGAAEDDALFTVESTRGPRGRFVRTSRNGRRRKGDNLKALLGGVVA